MLACSRTLTYHTNRTRAYIASLSRTAVSSARLMSSIAPSHGSVGSAAAAASAPSVHRAIFSDLDGTILPARSVLPPLANLRALSKLGRGGVTRVLVTGRDANSARGILLAWGQHAIDTDDFAAAATPQAPGAATESAGAAAGNNDPRAANKSGCHDPQAALEAAAALPHSEDAVAAKERLALARAPIDYLIFSSGGGTLRVADWSLTDARTLGTLALMFISCLVNCIDFDCI